MSFIHIHLDKVTTFNVTVNIVNLYYKGFFLSLVETYINTMSLDMFLMFVTKIFFVDSLLSAYIACEFEFERQ